jgi:hypothetical protein
MSVGGQTVGGLDYGFGYIVERQRPPARFARRRVGWQRRPSLHKQSPHSSQNRA